MHRLRILHTANSYWPQLDGVAQVVKNISERLSRKGHEVHVATSADRFKNLETLNGVTIHRFGLAVSNASLANEQRRLYQNFLAEGKWDVIGVHAAACWTTNLLIDCVAKLHSKLVFIPHGLKFWNAPSQKTVYETLGVALKQFDATTALSSLLIERQFYSQFSLPTPRVIPNAVDLSEFQGPTLGLRGKWAVGKKPWVVNVSNHSKVQKGHSYLHRLANELHREGIVVTNIGNSYPTSRAGLGKFGIRGGCYYECRAKSMLTSSLRLKSKIPRSQVCSALKEADVFVLTSDYEASPIVILEAMAARTPWVSFDVGNLSEYPGGFIVESVREMIDKLRYLLEHKDEATELGSNGQDLILRYHDWDKVAFDYEGLYLSLF